MIVIIAQQFIIALSCLGEPERGMSMATPCFINKVTSKNVRIALLCRGF